MANQLLGDAHGCGRRGRELHLIDIENLLAGPGFSVSEVSTLKPIYLQTSGAATQAHHYVGASASESCINGGLGWGQGLPTFVPGKDGAERSLTAAVPLEFATRFARVVIGSGDGFFASYATALQARGTAVTVVCRLGSLSRQLRRAVSDIRFLPEGTGDHALYCASAVAA